MQFNPNLADITPYEGGKPIELVVREYGITPEEVVKLASNENPLGTSAKVADAIRANAHKAHLYPDDSMYTLKNALSRHFGVARDQIVIGAGSDQVIEFAIRAKAGTGAAILTAGITFAMYEIYAKQVGIQVFKTPSPTHDLQQFLDLYRKHPDIGIIFLCLPNNPLGESLPTQEVYAFLEKIDPDTLVVVDGAYQEYAAAKDPAYAIDPKTLIERFANVLYLGTFSKAYALGGMRVGYGIARHEIISTLYKLRPPFNVTTLSLVAAEAALNDEAFVAKSLDLNFQQMERYRTFAQEHAIDFIESYTNFITFILPPSHKASEIAQNLLKKGIIIRDLTGYGLNGVRITIGTPEQNDRFLNLFDEVLKA